MGSVSDRRWPVAPLMKCLGVVTPGELAAACGVGDRDAERAMSYGLTLSQLDAWFGELVPYLWTSTSTSASKPGPPPAVTVLAPPAAPALPDGMVFEDPPAPRRGPRSSLVARCEPLKEHPGRWARIGLWETAGAADSAASALRKQGFEARTSRAGEGPGPTFVYARWPEATTAVPARKAG